MLKFYVGAANVAVYDGMRDRAAANPDEPVNTATVTATLKTLEGEVADPAHGLDVPLPHVAGSKGRYLGVFDARLAIEEGAEYWLEITVANPADFRRVKLKAEYRGVE